jgi:iron-sulfur cluster assembly accessory protein
MSATTAPRFTMSITAAAADEIRRFVEGEAGLPETAGLRLRVVPGGCSGFQYRMGVEGEARPGDRVLVGAPGVRLFVDMFSAQYLNGVEIDYVTSVMGSGFAFKNPNATGGCGCGTSFTA